MNKGNFVDKNPSLSTYWRSVILLGRNTASYKFALAKSLLENGSSFFRTKLRDSFPVSPLLTLIIPKRHVETYLDLNENETNEMATVLKKTRHQILEFG